jgi:hypothetical protein
MRKTLDGVRCPSCGYSNGIEALACGMCGAVLGRTPVDEPVLSRPPAVTGYDFDVDEEPREPWQRKAIVLGLGAAIAPAFAFLPIVSMMGWFLASLCHEIGHTVVAWLFGMPAFPAIRLDGHAASVHQPQKTFLVLLIWAGLAWIAWRARNRIALLVPAAVLVVLYPLLAWTESREVLHLLGGHLGECAFAAVFLWRALDGGFSDSKIERVLYAGLASFLLGHNVTLCFGLMTSAIAVDQYRNNGSFGLTNDYLRLAEDILHCPLSTVAAIMLVVALATPAAVFGLRALRDNRSCRV